MLARQAVTIPTDGINVIDAPTEIGDQQALALTNMRIMGSALESVRPQVSQVARTSTAFKTGDVLIYRKRSGTVQYLFSTLATDNSSAIWRATAPGATPSLVLNTTSGSRARLLQFGDVVYLFDGSAANKVWNGSALSNMGITAPTVAMNTTGNTGALTRDYYFTYYNATLDIESNPSPVASISNATDGATKFKVFYSTDGQVTHIRVYRTGDGITVPRRIDTIATIPNVLNGGWSAQLTDTSAEVDVAQGLQLAFDHDKPPVLIDGIITNNRLFALDATRETVWISNEYHPEYMPIYPFTDQEHIQSGGPIQIAPGDGGKIAALIPYGGAVIALKDNNIAYLIQESEVGFYGYQRMTIPSTVSGRSAVMTPWGLIYLASEGFVVIDSQLGVTDIGWPISNYTNTLDANGRAWTVGYYSAGYYIATMDHPDYGWLTFIFNGQSWAGPFSSSTLAGSLYGGAFYEDTDGKLYTGTCGTTGGIALAHLADTGLIGGQDTHEATDIAWIDKAREYAPERYTRLRYVDITAQTLSTEETPTVQSLDFVLRDDGLNELARETFSVPLQGRVRIPLDSPQAQYLSVGVEGSITTPVRISKIEIEAEPGVIVQGE